MPIRPVSIMSVSIASKLLEISWPVTAEELTSAFRAAAKKYHPDRGGSEQQMKDVNAAHEFLKKELERIPIGARTSTGQPHPGSNQAHANSGFGFNGWWTGAWSNSAGFGSANTNWDDIWRAADEFARQQNERHRQREESERRRQQAEDRINREAQSRSAPSKPEEHKYVPPKNPQESFDRARVKTREGFCILEHWQPSKSKPGNITRLFTNLGGLRCTIYWSAKEGLYRWSSYLGPNIPTAFSQRAFSSRKEAVEDLAKILFEKVDS